MTFPSAESDKLILVASFSLSPCSNNEIGQQAFVRGR